jgi:hypothetical protein
MNAMNNSAMKDSYSLMHRLISSQSKLITNTNKLFSSLAKAPRPPKLRDLSPVPSKLGGLGGPSESLEQKRAERREIQSKASEAANTEESADSVGKALGKKLNLNKIVEENEIVGGVKQALDSDDASNREK